MTVTWTNANRKLSELIPWPRNPRKIEGEQADRLVESFDQFGQVETIAVGPGNEIYNGHQRLAVLMEQHGPDYEVDVRVSDRALSEKEREKLTILLHKGAAGEFDWEALSDWNMDELKEWGFSAEELDALDLGGEEEEPKEDPGAQPDRAEELLEKWKVKPGDIFSLGDHRLICGNSTDPLVVECLMQGEKAEMVWTDPPYGVAVGDKNKFLNSIARSNRVEENLENDTLDEPDLVAMLEGAFDNAIAHCLAGAAWHVAAPARPLHVLFGQVLKDRGIWRQTIQWVKNNATFAPMGVCYHWRSEPIFFGWLPNGAHRYYGGRKQDTVWEIDRPTKSPEHPTMKPVELVERAIENHTQKGEIVLDVFGGSGTTLVACERLGRKCRMIELAPKYCSVILERWSTMTGKQPELIR
jgi:DNA modification methylase